MALTSSRRTGGGAYSKVCRKGLSSFFFFSVDTSAENGTDCWAVIWVRGCNQLNNNNNFLTRWMSQYEYVFVAEGLYLVSDNPAAMDVRRLTISCSHNGRDGLRRSLLLVIEKWNHKPSRIEYCINFFEKDFVDHSFSQRVARLTNTLSLPLLDTIISLQISSCRTFFSASFTSSFSSSISTSSSSSTTSKDIFSSTTSRASS